MNRIQRTLWRLCLSLALGGVLMAGCADDFEPYEKVEGLRLLAMSADKPQLLPTETATFSALVSEDATYLWSWCPFAIPVDAGGGCAISLEEFQMLAGSTLVPDYNLGNAETATLSHNIDPALYRTICQQLLGTEVPDGFDVPDCTHSFEVQISLTVTAGGHSVSGISTLDFLLDTDALANQNPVFAGISAGEGELSKTPLLDGTAMKRGVLYKLELDIGEDSSETFLNFLPMEGPEEKRENLVATWFYQGGEMDKSHSSFIPGSTQIEVLRENEWTPPLSEEYPDSELTLYVVIRDGRGGLSWQVRNVELVNP